MNKVEINMMVKNIVSEHLDINHHFVTRNRRIVDDLGADSMNFLEIVIDIERQLNISIEDYLLSDVSTVGDLIDVAADVAMPSGGDRVVNIGCLGCV
ncbi:acyl carrier protein [Nitrosomonas aestuarii]|uniref:Acyl carrier protein n=1 Tax=Nitrosomonas aestuarii TaxID=52441 RepID=A0A1I4B4S2_9PROT|nr:acyl carrier protein [Nitrosomonas aestuarii]SFK63714.1 acyl carrier protein [Nitrosomonas aestuarii]